MSPTPSAQLVSLTATDGHNIASTDQQMRYKNPGWSEDNKQLHQNTITTITTIIPIITIILVQVCCTTITIIILYYHYYHYCTTIITHSNITTTIIFIITSPRLVPKPPGQLIWHPKGQWFIQPIYGEPWFGWRWRVEKHRFTSNLCLRLLNWNVVLVIVFLTY